MPGLVGCRSVIAATVLYSVQPALAEMTDEPAPDTANTEQRQDAPEAPNVVICTEYCCVESGKMICRGYPGTIPGAPPVASSDPIEPSESERWKDLLKKYWEA